LEEKTCRIIERRGGTRKKVHQNMSAWRGGEGGKEPCSLNYIKHNKKRGHSRKKSVIWVRIWGERKNDLQMTQVKRGEREKGKKGEENRLGEEKKKY